MEENKINGNLLDVTNDYVFRRIFGEKGNEEITKDLVEKILKTKYYKIDLSKNPIILPEHIDGKGSVLDVIIEAEDIENINIEMQVAPYKYMIERILEYWSKKYSEEFRKSEDYSLAKRTVCILIACYDIKPLNKIIKCHTKWNIREEEYSEIILTDKLEFHIINLKKLENLKDKELLNWCKFIISPEALEEKIMEENNSIKKAKEELEKISEDEQERELAYRRERAIRNQNAIRAYGFDEGKEEGIKEGITRRNIEIAKKMLVKNIDFDSIIEITGLSKEELEKLK